MKVFFLPGMMCDRALWQKVFPLLDAWIEPCYLPMERCASRQEIYAMMDEACATPAHIVGFSMGGYVALEYGITRGCPYQSLVMVGASAFGLPQEEKERRLSYLPLLREREYKGISRHRLAQFVHPDKVDDPRVGGVVREMDARLGKTVLIAQLESGSLRENYLDEVGNITCPALVIGGALDAVIKPRSLEKLTEALPNGALEMLPDTGHMIPLEKPQQVAAALNRFYACLR